MSAASPSLLHRLFEVAQAQPDHLALVEGDRSITYGELWGRVGTIAQALASLVKPQDRVALVMDNGLDYVASVYGAWAAGAVVVGLNTSLKEPDLLQQISHCQARVVLLGKKSAKLAEPAAALGVAVLYPQDLPESLPMASQPLWPVSGLAPVALASHAPATIIYTSGTTGLPKGVALSHGNLSANVAAVQQSLPIRADDIALCPLPFFYAYGFSVLHTHLSMGAALVLENSFMYPQKVLQRMAALGVTSFYGVPSTYYLLLERDHLSQASLGQLRYAAQAGGAMDPARIALFRERLPNTDFYVMYGQTEACSRLTTLPSHALARKTGSVGLPLPGVSLSIRDPDGAQLATRQIGEVCARGPNVMQGYWQADEDTAQVIRQDWLWTGDLGYLDEDGFLHLTGRSREMIKTGAHRVSPWEIEQLINGVAGVKETAVLSMPDRLLGDVIRACVIADLPTETLRRDILQVCKARLAPHKIPRQVDFLAHFPRTASGKVQKHLLRPDTDDKNQYEH
jgi:long-chain acyl-CoA synthetase